MLQKSSVTATPFEILIFVQDHADIAAQTIKSIRFQYRYLLVYTMSTVTSNNRKPIGLCMLLNCVSYLSIAYAWFYCKDIETFNCPCVLCFLFLFDRKYKFQEPRYLRLNITTLTDTWLLMGGNLFLTDIKTSAICNQGGTLICLGVSHSE